MLKKSEKSNFIPYGTQNINSNDIKEVISVLKSEFLTQGPLVTKFEEQIVNYCKAKHATVVNSATSALHIACLSLGLKKGDLLWTSPNTFVASANCAIYCNADIDFVDIDIETRNISIEALEEKLSIAEKNNKLPKIIVPVHFGGNSCDMIRIKKLSQIYGFKIIEDASHAIGAEYKGSKVGSCKYSDITIFSFHPVKIITTGEGGAATTNSKLLNDKMNLLRSHGITRDKTKFIGKTDEEWAYQQLTVGFNYRMTDIQAALGISQMSRLDNFIDKRNYLAKIYNSLLKGNDLSLARVDSENKSSMHLYTVLFRNKKKRDSIYRKMIKENIGVNIHYIPVHTQPFFREIGFKRGMFPKSEEYYSKTLTLPLHTKLTKKDMTRICKIIINS